LQLYRVFYWDGHSTGASEGGPLFVPQELQGAGRHDIPELDGVIYTSVAPVSCVAEAIKDFRSQEVRSAIFLRPDGHRRSLAAFDLADTVRLLDLDDPKELVKRGINPSQVSSPTRSVTQGLTRQLFEEGLAGFYWWSALNASWKNVTLFKSRVIKSLSLKEKPVELKLDLPVVREAGDFLKVNFR